MKSKNEGSRQGPAGLSGISLLPDISRNLSLAQGWLRRTFLSNATGDGWPLYLGQGEVSEWGGTLDAIMALHRCGVPATNSQIHRSVAWLMGQQQADGGWGSWEISNSCVEATAWVLLALQLLDRDELEGYREGVSFLERTAERGDGLACWGAYAGAQPRVYTTSMAIWALATTGSESVLQGCQWLLSARNSDGGWGFLQNDERSNGVTTALSMIALSSAGRLTLSVSETAIDWLWLARSEDGLWSNAVEDWISWVQDDGRGWPTVTNHGVTPFAIKALLAAGVDLLDERLQQSVKALARSQQADGSWIFDEENAKRYVWSVGDAVWALSAVQEAAREPALVAELLRKDLVPKLDRLSRGQRYLWICLVLLLVTVTLLATDLGEGVAGAVEEAASTSFDWASRNRDELLFWLVTSGIGGAALAVWGRRKAALAKARRLSLKLSRQSRPKTNSS